MGHEIIQITLTEQESEKLKLLEDENFHVPVSSPSNKPLIRRALLALRKHYDEKKTDRYFKPIFVSFGPLHHVENSTQDSILEEAEKFKQQLATTFIHYSGSRKDDFYKKVKKEIKSLRECYDPMDVAGWGDEELAWMFLVDGCALLQFIFLVVENKWGEFGGKNDQLLFVINDVFLLENQLPFQLLEILIDLCIKVSNEGGKNPQEVWKVRIDKFIKEKFLSSADQISIPIHDQVDSQTPLCAEQRQQQEEPVHLLALLRRELIGQGVKSQEKPKDKDSLLGKLMRKWCSSGDKSRKWHTFRNVKELKAKGIRFKAKEKIDGITDIDLNYRSCLPTLMLAPILVDDTTMPILLNLIAYELSSDFKNEYEISSYITFLESLIDSGEDVKELREAGVLFNGLGSDEAVAEMFNKISDYLVPNPVKYEELKVRIQEHCDLVWASDVAYFYYTHFSSPWSFLVFLGAVAGLVLTGLSTYNSFN
ncbi:hypothetical protein SLA2020_061390 [Shorea laevis]